mmetsp:Transcript_18311/g.54373  ORF Transcript_18311/g.54373 Transcript_18311/m.54373 type:complete len:309 (-) Transcript_18311:267-1193(-)
MPAAERVPSPSPKLSIPTTADRHSASTAAGPASSSAADGVTDQQRSSEIATGDAGSTLPAVGSKRHRTRVLTFGHSSAPARSAGRSPLRPSMIASQSHVPGEVSSTASSAHARMLSTSGSSILAPRVSTSEPLCANGSTTPSLMAAPSALNSIVRRSSRRSAFHRSQASTSTLDSAQPDSGENSTVWPAHSPPMRRAGSATEWREMVGGASTAAEHACSRRPAARERARISLESSPATIASKGASRGGAKKKTVEEPQGRTERRGRSVTDFFCGLSKCLLPVHVPLPARACGGGVLARACNSAAASRP